MSNQSKEELVDAVINRKGVFGFGFSTNENLDLMNLVVLAVSGIIVKIFFQENYTKLGTSGPAATTIWGYGLTAISLVLMVFMSIYLTRKKNNLFIENDNIFEFCFSILSSNILPIVLTLGIIIYIIVLNFIYFTRINSNKVSSSYLTYSLFSSLLVIIQIGIIIKYMFTLLTKVRTIKNTDDNVNKTKENEEQILKGVTLIVTTINYIFVLILHILLAFFSTDG